MMGRWLKEAMSLMICSVKAPGIAATPTRRGPSSFHCNSVNNQIKTKVAEVGLVGLSGLFDQRLLRPQCGGAPEQDTS